MVCVSSVPNTPHPRPGLGLLPLLGTAPGLCCAATPALVGDCGKMPLSRQLEGPGRGWCEGPCGGGFTPQPISLSPSFPPWAGHHTGVQCIPHRQGHSLRGQWLRVRPASSRRDGLLLRRDPFSDLGRLSLLSGWGEGEPCFWYFQGLILTGFLPLPLCSPKNKKFCRSDFSLSCCRAH